MEKSANIWDFKGICNFIPISLVQQHVDSFNEFVESGIQEIVNEIDKVAIEGGPIGSYFVEFGRVIIGTPRIREADGSKRLSLPAEARIRNATYSAPIFLEMAETDGNTRSEFQPVYIGDLPIMLKSNVCVLFRKSPDELIALGEDPKDPGGYFIINGSERIMVGLEDLAPNRILVDVERGGSKPTYKAKVFSTTVGFRARIELTLKTNDTIQVSIPGVPTKIPYVILMRALGVEKDKEIADLTSANKLIQEELNPSFDEAEKEQIRKADDAKLYIGNRVAYGQIKEYRIKRAELVLDNNLLPHLGRSDGKRFDKALFLAEMASRLIELKLGMRSLDDKDHYSNKRLKFAGALLAELFRTAFRSLCKDMKYQLEKMSIKKPGKERIPVAVRPSIITERLQHALATGNWGRGKVGITQLLDRTNYISTISHLHRVQSPLSRSQPNFEARELHASHWGRLCPVETPEGSNCGLVKNTALLTEISRKLNEEDVKQLMNLLYSLGVVKIEQAIPELKTKASKVFLNGNLIGFVKDPETLVYTLRSKRRKGEISHQINVALQRVDSRREVEINCDDGRARRPLLVVENGKMLLNETHVRKLASKEISWDDLVKQGVVEYLDASEEENALVALRPEKITPEHTHVELPPFLILGVCASFIPFAEHNQSPRNSYEAAMVKQTLGMYAINYSNRVDAHSYTLQYPQLPLTTTATARYLGYEDRPVGQNCVVAVLPFWGYNMEDAIVLNKSSTERGLGVSISSRLYEAECKSYLGGQRDKFEIPELGIKGYRGEQFYRNLEPDGAIAIESVTCGGDVLVGRTSPPRFLEEYRMEAMAVTKRDTSVSLRPFEKGLVDSVFVTETTQGNRLVKVKVRDLRIPEIGDKFASRHGQKGVVGLLVAQEDMPFTEDGLVPDIIINPHAIPSRMTIGQFLESIAGKVAALEGHVAEASPFTNAKEGLRDALLKLGFQYSGKEVLYDGITGRKYEADIFIGLVYYQKLHHMVADKIHARSRGQVQMLTRQPTEGRARGGGLRFGEMERDCLIGYGASSLLRDRLLEESDRTVIYICEKCGYMAYYDLKTRRFVCRACGDEASVSPVIASYAFKLLLQELMSLCIRPKLKLKDQI